MLGLRHETIARQQIASLEGRAGMVPEAWAAPEGRPYPGCLSSRGHDIIELYHSSVLRSGPQREFWRSENGPLWNVWVEKTSDRSEILNSWMPAVAIGG
jgi:hypothetical protein